MMTATKPHPELTGLERFAHLEDKIYRVVEAFRAIQKENHSLRNEVRKLRSELEARAEQERKLAELQQERRELRERVEKTLDLLASLEP